MLCEDCLKVPRALEPVGEGSYKPPLSMQELVSKLKIDNPYAVLAVESAKSLGNGGIPSSQFLVPRDLDIELKTSIEALELSANEGCEACQYWSTWVPESLQNRPNVHIGIMAPPEDLLGMKLPDLNRLNLFFSERNRTPNEGAGNDSLPNEIDEKRIKIIFDISVSQDNAAAGDQRIPGRPLSHDAEGRQSLTNLREWLRDCTSSHECKTHQSELAPTRLLDLGSVQGTDDIRLHITDTDFNERYIALSYCWGNASSLFTTTTETLGARMKSIEVNIMPRLFQEVIKVVRELDVRYLWVDALCIIQDSVQDWATESIKMGSIYQNSYLTIVASSSTSIDSKLLHETPDTSFLEMPFRGSGMDESGQIILQHFDPKLEPRNSSREHWRQPIHTRGWTLQERFLSTRTVFFDPDQFFFECHEGQQFESSVDLVILEGRDYPDQLATGRRGNDNFAGNLSKSRLAGAWSKETIYEPHPLLYADKYAQVEFNEHWHRLLIDYGLRNLTYTSDVLIAMSGMAKKFAEDLEDLYMAGIWAKDFRKGLLWNMRWYQTSTQLRIAPRIQQILEELPEHQKIIAASGPSWSWASRFTAPDKINFSVVASQKPLHDDRDAELLSFFAQPLFETEEVFGPLKIAVLGLKGYVAELKTVFTYTAPDVPGIDSTSGVLLLRQRSDLIGGSTGHLTTCFDSIPEIVPRGFKPEAGSSSPPISLKALIIAGFSTNVNGYSNGKRPMYYGLILKPTEFMRSDGDFVYQRVGIFSMDTNCTTAKTFKDPIGFDIFVPLPDTWTGWEEREVEIV